jgi:hypothetical protein
MARGAEGDRTQRKGIGNVLGGDVGSAKEDVVMLETGRLLSDQLAGLLQSWELAPVQT